MRTAARIDVNQPEIVQALRQVGATVLHLHQLGKGAPDLLVGFRGVVYLLEVKQPGHADDLTPDEREFHVLWGKTVNVVTTPEEALRVIGAIA